MRSLIKARDLPGRISTGVFVLHSGLEKWHSDAANAAVVYGMAVGAFPMLACVPARQLTKRLAAGEVATGAVLLCPLASNALAGPALSGFSGALLAMYARTPSLRKSGSIWPTQAGIGVSKDGLLLGLPLPRGIVGERGAVLARPYSAARNRL